MKSPLSESKLPAKIHLDTFQTFAHRSATEVEQQVLAYALDLPFAASASTDDRQASLDFPNAESQVVGKEGMGRSALWVHGLRPEALAYLTVSLSHVSLGKRILFLSNDRRQLEERQMRFASRAKLALFNPISKAVRPADPGGYLLYCSIDQIDEARLCRIWGAGGPDIIVVENAHIFSPYSHEFRAKGAELNQLQKRWPDAQLILESARLSGEERQECEERIGLPLKQPALHESLGHLRLEVLRSKDIGAQDGNALADSIEASARNSIENLAETLPRPSLFLAQTPQQVDQIYARLLQAQVPIHRLHSAMPESERARELLQFTLPGRRAVMVSTMRTASTSTEQPQANTLKVGGTNPPSGEAEFHQPASAELLPGQEVSAVPDHFGRGYARADIRSIVHLNAPQSLAQYTQDLSLLAAHCIDTSSIHPKNADADADEEPQALVFADPQDLIAAHEQLGARGPSADLLEASLPYLIEKGPETSIPELAIQLGVSRKRLSFVLAYLKDSGALQPSRTSWNAKIDGPELSILGKQLVDELVIHRSADALRLAKVEKYWESTGCRRQALLSFFGEAAEACGACDYCAKRKAPADPPKRVKASPRRRKAS